MSRHNPSSLPPGRLTRRSFCAGALSLAGASSALGRLVPEAVPDVDIRRIERARTLRAARLYLRQQPLTITASASPRSAGGKHDYFSEGDYWWPDPGNPGGPYIQRDGMSNPGNFGAHRLALIRLSVQMPALTAAWLVSGDRACARRAADHLRAWFVADDTRMNPHLEFAQAIHGRTSGRGTGIIDTVHLVEVARAAARLEPSRALTTRESTLVRRWFEQYLQWLATSKHGREERDAKNNHGTCWVVQAAEFARLTANPAMSGFCRERFKSVLVPTQIAGDGSFPLELRRTKPYGYCLFNLDAMAMACQILSSPGDDLWSHATADGRGIAKALAFMVPFIADKRSWPYPHDVQYFDEWPVRHPSLLFGGIALARPAYVELWRTLDPDPAVPEVIRNFPYRQPLLWLPHGRA